LYALPIVPDVTDRAREIYRQGLENGRSPQVFTKVGDCMTASEEFLFPYGAGHYDLGEYGNLQEFVDYFSTVTIREHEGQPVNSFSNPSLTVVCGFNSASPLDPIWADPAYCESGEAPLGCELRVSNASLVLIMLGTHDMYFTTEKFQGYMESIVEEAIGVGAVPVLLTFPYRLDKLEDTLTYNEVVVKVAEEYGVPVANLWLALKDLPNYGIEQGEVTKLSLPDDDCATCFTEDNLSTGSAVHNLVAMQALYTVWMALSE
jgi:hypothetical protein